MPSFRVPVCKELYFNMLYFNCSVSLRIRLGDEEGNVQAATLPFRLSGVDISCDLTPEAVEQAVIKAKKAGIQHLTREKGFILKREGSNQVAVLLPSVMPTGLSSQELTKMELDTRRQVLYYVEAFRRYLKGMEQCELTMIGPSIGFRETEGSKESR